MTEDKDFKVTDKRGEEKEVAAAPEEVAIPKEQEVQASSEESSDDTVEKFPEVNFINLAASLGTSCMMHLGLLENPGTKEKSTNVEMAQHEIDLLTMLEKKTKGNLNEQEEKFLTQLLYELRMHFVEVNKK